MLPFSGKLQQYIVSFHLVCYKMQKNYKKTSITHWKCVRIRGLHIWHSPFHISMVHCVSLLAADEHSRDWTWGFQLWSSLSNMYAILLLHYYSAPLKKKRRAYCWMAYVGIYDLQSTSFTSKMKNALKQFVINSNKISLIQKQTTYQTLKYHSIYEMPIGNISLLLKVKPSASI